MLRFQALFVIASLALTLYSFIDCAKRDESLIQKLPKWGWLTYKKFFTFAAFEIREERYSFIADCSGLISPAIAN